MVTGIKLRMDKRNFLGGVKEIFHFDYGGRCITIYFSILT